MQRRKKAHTRKGGSKQEEPAKTARRQVRLGHAVLAVGALVADARHHLALLPLLVDVCRGGKECKLKGAGEGNGVGSASAGR